MVGPRGAAARAGLRRELGHGRAAGLVTAIVAGALAAVFGGSRVQVSGPTGAMTVVLVPIVAAHGADGVLVVGLLAGLILVGLGYAGAGRFIRYVPVPVVEGFTLGIAAIIALQQVPAALGVDVPGREGRCVPAARAVRAWVQRPRTGCPSLAVGVAVVVILGCRGCVPRLPGSLLAVVAATVANSGLGLGPPHRDHPGRPAGAALPHRPLGRARRPVLPAVAVAALAALESLLSATVADAMSVGQRHDSDRELFGQGLANLAAPLFGGIPATAAIARTAVNVRSGATSRLAAVTHALVLLVVVLVAARWVAEIPLAALAGVLIATARPDGRVSSLLALLRSTRGDAAVLAVTAAATIALRPGHRGDRRPRRGRVLRAAADGADRPPRRDPPRHSDHSDEERALLDEHIVAYRIDGPLFFAAAHDFLLELSDVSDVRVVILRMSRVTTLDATGAHVLADTISRLEATSPSCSRASSPSTSRCSASSACTTGWPTSTTSSHHTRRDRARPPPRLPFPHAPAALTRRRSRPPQRDAS